MAIDQIVGVSWGERMMFKKTSDIWFATETCSASPTGRSAERSSILLTVAMKLRELTMLFSKGLLIFLFVLSAGNLSAEYKPTSAECAGLPKLPISSVEGTCIGLLAGPEVGFIKPRKALQIPGTNQILVTDMGGWSDNRGILWLLDFYTDADLAGPVKAHKLSTGLSLPHDIQIGPDGAFYLGEADQILRFTLSKRRMTDVETVISDLPYDPDGYLHPLTNFVFLENGDLLVNVGSKTDACGEEPAVCAEAEFVGLRLYSYTKESSSWAPDYKLYATGLRNSMALAVHSSGTILQAENSSDIRSSAEPYDEINVIKEGGFYGWPYCLNRAFDQEKIPKGCNQPNYVAPFSLMPPHVAPLDMIYFDSDTIPALENRLVMSWHGYRVVGNRLVSYEVDADGLPVLSGRVSYAQDPIAPQTAFTTHAFQPKGGTESDAQHTEIIFRWNEISGVRPEGAPVGLSILKDGTLLIVDDKNKALLRLAPGKEYRDPEQNSSAVMVKDYKFEEAALVVMKTRCGDCHNELLVEPERLLSDDQWLEKEEGTTVLERRLTDHPRRMPPGQPLDSKELNLLLDALKEN